MAKRHSDAVAIQQGACNPSGIAISLLDAIREARAEGLGAAEDAAVRLIVHQLAHVCRAHDDHLTGIEYHRLIAECEEKRAVKP